MESSLLPDNIRSGAAITGPLIPSRLPILMYHRVISSVSCPERHAVSLESFRTQIALLRRMKYQTVSLDDLVCSSTLSKVARPVVITFDDGYRDNLENALPVLEEAGFTATFFIVSSLVGKRSEWAQGCGELMDWGEIRQTRGRGMTLGAHSRTHKRLTSLDQSEIKREIAGSRREIEESVGAPVCHFSYPYGSYTTSITETVASSGFLTACTTDSGFASASPSLMHLRRIEVTGMDSILTFGCKLIYGDNKPSSKLKALGFLKLAAEMFAWRRIHF